MVETKTHVGEGGRVVIPAAVRRALGLETGDEILLLLDEDGLRLVTPRQAVRRAQALVRRYVREGRSLSAELLADRRKEARRG